MSSYRFIKTGQNLYADMEGFPRNSHILYDAKCICIYISRSYHNFCGFCMHFYITSRDVQPKTTFDVQV